MTAVAEDQTGARVSPQLRVWPGVVFVIATALGLMLRAVYVGWSSGVPFDHLLHSHSHALYFGWAGLTILAAATDHLPTARRWAWAALTLTLPMTVAFLLQGYAPASIAGSTLVMLAWYGAIWSWWRRRREASSPAGIGVALAYVLVASAGIWVLAIVQATGRGDTIAVDLAVHAFLSGFAWAMVIGTAALTERMGLIDANSNRAAIRGWAAVAWILFPLGVVGGPEVPGLGWAARAGGILVLYPTWLWLRGAWDGAAGDTHRLALRAAAASLAAAVAGLAAVAIFGSPLLGYVGRQGVVFYLHALLLGGVSTVLIRYLGDGLGERLRPSLLVHVFGVGLMLAGIALLIGGLVLGAWLALAGAVAAWAAGLGWAWLIWHRQPSR